MKRNLIVLVIALLLGGRESSRAVELFVASAGCDENPGTQAQPFKTLAAACNVARETANTTITLRRGVYPCVQTVHLGPVDSGLTIRPSPGEQVTLQAARPVNAAEFAPAHSARLPVEAREQVLMVDLRALGIQHLGPWKDEFPNGNGDIVELLYKGKRMPLARWPNNGPTTMKRVLDNGAGRGGTFEYRDGRAARWPVEQGVWLRGYWRVPWEIETVRIAALDPLNHTITLAAPVPGGIGSKYQRPGGSGQEPYWVVNALEELDQPGEWCLDFKSGRLYFWPPASLADGDVMICDRDTPVIAITGASNVTIQGLTIEGGLGNAIEITKGSSNRVVGCEIRGFQKWGVVVKGGTDHAVAGCHIHDMGAGGIILDGGDRLSLTPARHSASNNHIHDFGQIQQVYAGGIQLPPGSVGMYVAHNLIHDAPHGGVYYGGNDHLLELNEIHHVCLVSEDMGGFYTYYDWTSYGNVVRYNYVHDSPLAHGVYCDDGDSGDTVYGNIFYKLDVGVFISGGHDNIVTNNIAIDCRRGLHIDTRGVTRGYNLANKRLTGGLKAVHPERPPWSRRYPALTKLLGFHPELPTGTVFDRNLMVRCGAGIDRSGKPAELRFTRFGQNLELQTDPGFVNIEQLDFRLRPEAVVFEQLPGFQMIPVEQIGLLKRQRTE